MRTQNRFRPRLKAHVLFLPLLAAVLLAYAGCSRTETQPAAPRPPPQTSSIRVSTQADGVHLRTKVAEFVLRPSGYLQGNLQGESEMLTLDDPGSDAGQQVILSGHRVAEDFALDLSRAKVTAAQGKLGTGQRVEIPGASASTALEETLTLEVYDDFPSLALLSAAFRNAGQQDVALDSVTLQSHRFNAGVSNTNAAPHEMWSFHGSSLSWGKDDVLPITA